MTHFKPLTVFSFLLAAGLLSCLAAGASSGAVEIRSAVIVYDGTSFSGGSGADGNIIDPTNFAGFYYDLDTDSKTESILLSKNGTGTKIDMVYTTKPEFRLYEYQEDSWKSNGFSIIGFFAEPYVALETGKTKAQADRIAKLLVDSDEKYTMRTGQALNLNGGYVLYVKQIDVNGNKAWLELTRDGQTIDNGIVSTASDSRTWIMRQTVLGEKDTEVFRVHVEQVFQGAESSLVEIKGLWLVDFENAVEVRDTKDYGKFEADSIGEDSLSYKVSGYALSNDKDDLLGQDLRIRVIQKSPGTYSFYFYKEYSENGTYDVRSSVCSIPGSGREIFTPLRFSGLYYDFDEDLWTEVIDLSYNTKIPQGGFKYYSVPAAKSYDFGGWRFDGREGPDKFHVIGIFGEPYVPLSNRNSSGDDAVHMDMIAKLLIDSDERYTMAVGQALDIGENYTIHAKQIDVNGNKVLLEVQKEGKTVETSIINAAGQTVDDRTWVLEKKVLGEDNIQVMRIYVDEVFQGSESSLVEISGLWAIDYENAREIKSDDKFGKLEFDGIGAVPAGLPVSGNALIFRNDAALSLGGGKKTVIGGNMNLQTSADGTRFYLFVEKIIGDGTAAELSSPTPAPSPTPSETTPEASPTPPETTPEASASPPETTPAPETSGPGLAVLFALLAAAGALGRRRK